jgi:hypothetical protein
MIQLISALIPTDQQQLLAPLHQVAEQIRLIPSTSPIPPSAAPQNVPTSSSASSSSPSVSSSSSSTANSASPPSSDASIEEQMDVGRDEPKWQSVQRDKRARQQSKTLQKSVNGKNKSKKINSNTDATAPRRQLSQLPPSTRHDFV